MQIHHMSRCYARDARRRRSLPLLIVALAVISCAHHCGVGVITIPGRMLAELWIMGGWGDDEHSGNSHVHSPIKELARVWDAKTHHAIVRWYKDYLLTSRIICSLCTISLTIIMLLTHIQALCMQTL